jgi:hypothetical protein
VALLSFPVTFPHPAFSQSLTTHVLAQQISAPVVADPSGCVVRSGANTTIPPSVDEAIDILRAACIFSTKPLDGVESGVGESAFLKNLDAFLIFFNSPLAPNYLTCSPAVPVRGVEYRGKSNAGLGGSNAGEAK